MAKYIVSDTGEVLEEIEDNKRVVLVNYGDSVIRREARKHIVETVSMKTHFVKVGSKSLKSLYLNAKYINIIIDLVGYKDGILKFSNGIPINNKHLSKLFDISYRNTLTVIDKLRAEDVIHKKSINKKNYYYIFNPWIASRGARISKTLFDEFKDSKWRKVEENLSEEYYGNEDEYDV